MKMKKKEPTRLQSVSVWVTRLGHALEDNSSMK